MTTSTAPFLASRSSISVPVVVLKRLTWVERPKWL
jgi:hypothetical protein